jgi:nicotinamidase-related amidase
MGKEAQNLYGNVPDKAPVALLLIDVINDLDFPESDQLFKEGLPMAAELARFKKAVKAVGFPVIYVNDNFGRWRSDFKSQVRHCLEAKSAGKPIVELLRPEEDDYFVLKPKHSGFYSTTLELLLEHVEAHTLIVTGIATNICVLFTANDAYLRGYRLAVPADCVAANSHRLTKDALEQMQSILKADTRPWAQLPLAAWSRGPT